MRPGITVWVWIIGVPGGIAMVFPTAAIFPCFTRTIPFRIGADEIVP